MYVFKKLTNNHKLSFFMTFLAKVYLLDDQFKQRIKKRLRHNIYVQLLDTCQNNRSCHCLFNTQLYKNRNPSNITMQAACRQIGYIRIYSHSL